MECWNNEIKRWNQDFLGARQSFLLGLKTYRLINLFKKEGWKDGMMKKWKE